MSVMFCTLIIFLFLASTETNSVLLKKGGKKKKKKPLEKDNKQDVDKTESCSSSKELHTDRNKVEDSTSIQDHKYTNKEHVPKGNITRLYCARHTFQYTLVMLI